MLHVEWYHVCWPRLTAKRVEPVVSISWASCLSACARRVISTLPTRAQRVMTLQRGHVSTSNYKNMCIISWIVPTKMPKGSRRRCNMSESLSYTCYNLITIYQWCGLRPSTVLGQDRSETKQSVVVLVLRIWSCLHHCLLPPPWRVHFSLSVSV